jgi:hypothetical protein
MLPGKTPWTEGVAFAPTTVSLPLALAGKGACRTGGTKADTGEAPYDEKTGPPPFTVLLAEDDPPCRGPRGDAAPLGVPGRDGGGRFPGGAGPFSAAATTWSSRRSRGRD